MSARPVYALAAALALLAACASPPRYQTVSRYEAPTGAAAQACVEGCEQTRHDCLARCRADRQICLNDLEPEIDAQYAEALKRYARDLEMYRLELDRYRFNLWYDWNRGPWWYDNWWPPHYWPLASPVSPSRERIRERLGDERCDSDCGCRAGYDTCFTGCGGTRTEERRCIANCPPE
jgi:hypothetical protein